MTMHCEYTGIDSTFTPRVAAAEREAEQEAERREARALLDQIAVLVARRPDLAQEVEAQHGQRIAEARALLARHKGK